MLLFSATQKYAFMVANDDYENLEVLEKPAADIRDLAHLLSSMDFKVFAFRNLTLTEMRNAFISFCKMLMPGCYSESFSFCSNVKLRINIFIYSCDILLNFLVCINKNWKNSKFLNFFEIFLLKIDNL